MVLVNPKLEQVPIYEFGKSDRIGIILRAASLEALIKIRTYLWPEVSI